MGIYINNIEVILQPRKTLNNTDMNLDVRDKTVVYIVFRRESANAYHFQGVACAVENYTAEEVAIQMCRDETYFIFPCLLNVALPHSIVEAKGCYFPMRNNDTSNEHIIVDTTVSRD